MRISRRSTTDFAPRRDGSGTQWYNPDYDRVLIEQSIAKQYGIIPSEQEYLHYSDWAKLVSGLMDDTPLGRVISIRSETDRDVIRHMTPDQRRMRQEWLAYRSAHRSTEERQADIQALQAMIAGMFGGGR